VKLLFSPWSGGTFILGEEGSLQEEVVEPEDPFVTDGLSDLFPVPWLLIQLMAPLTVAKLGREANEVAIVLHTEKFRTRLVIDLAIELELLLRVKVTLALPPDLVNRKRWSSLPAPRTRVCFAEALRRARYSWGCAPCLRIRRFDSKRSGSTRAPLPPSLSQWTKTCNQ